MDKMDQAEQKKTAIKEYCHTKRLNFLIGSGASANGIPIMREFNSFGERANEKLLECIQIISKKILLFTKGEKYSFKELRKHILEIKTIEIDNKIKAKDIRETLHSYVDFIESLIGCLLEVNSRTIPRNVNVFTTNYDLFLESAINKVLENRNFVCNDGSRGYFTRILDWTNFNRVVAYKGINDDYNYELPSLNLIKPHGSVNWKRCGDSVLVTSVVCDNSFVVPPTGHESKDTFLTNYFYEMLRVFQLELEKPQSLLIVLGFSFQDSHIVKMVKRAIQNPELQIYVFAYSDNAAETIRKNLGISIEDRRLVIWGPRDFENKPLNLKEVTKILFSEENGVE